MANGVGYASYENMREAEGEGGHGEGGRKAKERVSQWGSVLAGEASAVDWRLHRVGQSPSLACDDSLHPGGDSGYRLVTSPLDHHIPPRGLPFSSTMGNSASSGRGHHEDTVDFGYLTPQGIYTVPRDWNQTIVNQLIIERKLAPFYRPLEEYDESWDDDQILAARKEPPEADGAEPSRAEPATTSPTVKGHAKRPSVVREPTRNPEAAIYRGAMECPICFLVCRDTAFILRSSASSEHSVLPPEHKSFAMLRPSYLHGVFRPNQESRTHNYPSSL